VPARRGSQALAALARVSTVTRPEDAQLALMVTYSESRRSTSAGAAAAAAGGWGGGGGGGAGAAGGGGGWLLEQHYCLEPSAPAGFLAGIEELAASGAVDIKREGFVYRALSDPEAKAVRASQAARAGTPEARLPLLFARPQAPPTAAVASTIMVD
jgi:hypothetical protein